MSTITPAAPPGVAELSLTRLHLMRAGYLFMAVGLAVVKWPLLPKADAANVPANARCGFATRSKSTTSTPRWRVRPWCCPSAAGCGTASSRPTPP